MPCYAPTILYAPKVFVVPDKNLIVEPPPSNEPLIIAEFGVAVILVNCEPSPISAPNEPVEASEPLKLNPENIKLVSLLPVAILIVLEAC